MRTASEQWCRQGRRRDHTVGRTGVLALTTDQMREVDRAMVKDLHTELIQMMENAGRSLPSWPSLGSHRSA